MPNATDPGGHLDISAWRQALLKEGLLLPGIYQGSHSPTPAPSALPDIRANAGSPSRRSLHSRLSGAADDKPGGSSGPRASGEFLRRSFTQMQDSDSSQRATTAPSDGMRNLSHSMSSANGASSSGSPGPSPAPHAASPIPGSSGTVGGSPAGSHNGGRGDNRTHGHNASHTCGVSLAWLGRLAETLGDSAAANTQSVIHRFLVPLTRSYTPKGGRLWDLIPPKHVGLPEYYIIHAWTNSFAEMVLQLLAKLTEDAEVDPTKVFVWLDIVALNQNNVSPGTTSEYNHAAVQQTLGACKKGAVVVVDRGNHVLSRMWCVFEAWASLRYGDFTKLQIAFPEHLTIDDAWQFEQACQRLDLAFCQCTKADDKAQLMQTIKHSVGVKLMVRNLTEALIRASRSAMRFSDKIEDVALYCALLLKGGEFCRCQQVLSLIDQLDDDEKMLEEIRSIFKMYDSDGSGELDQDEFIQVLKATGFDQAEAEKMYHEVDADGGGSVSLQEFEDWFRATQRTQGNRQRRRVVMTTEGLCENLDKMASLMRRNELPLYSAFFTDVFKRIKAAQLQKPTQALMASPLKGDWQTITDECMWSLHLKEWRTAACKMYDLLMQNSDALDFHPVHIPIIDRSPNVADAHRTAYVPSTGSTIPMKQALRLYLQLFASILIHQPGRRMHAEYFTSLVDELGKDNGRSMSKGASEGSEPILLVKKHKPKSSDLKSMQYDRIRFGIVRNMISLKYGVQQPISKPLICEAEMSIGQWMARNRLDDKSKGKGVNSIRGGMSDLATSYFASMGVRTLMPQNEKKYRASMEVNMDTVMLGAAPPETSSNDGSEAEEEEEQEEEDSEQRPPGAETPTLPDLSELRAVGGGFVVNRITGLSERHRASDEAAASSLEALLSNPAPAGPSGASTPRVQSPLPPADDQLLGAEGEEAALAAKLGGKPVGRAAALRESSLAPRRSVSSMTSDEAASRPGTGGMHSQSVSRQESMAFRHSGSGGGAEPERLSRSSLPSLTGGRMSPAPTGMGESLRRGQSISWKEGGTGGGAAAEHEEHRASVGLEAEDSSKSITRLSVRSSVVDELLAKMMPSSQVVPSKRQSAGKGSSLGSVVLSPLWDHDPNPQPRGGGGGGGKRPSVSSKPPQRAGQGPKRSVPLSS